MKIPNVFLLCHEHVNMLGHYSLTLVERVTKGQPRLFNGASEDDNIE